jgi:carbon-monoxide dehydrogenase medium subunit
LATDSERRRKMIPAQFDYFTPSSVQEAIKLLETYGDEAKILSGGHSLIPAMKLRLTSFKYLIDIGRIAGLNTITETNGKLRIGALATHHTIATSILVKEKCPLLSSVASQIGDMQVRNRGTLGGSLAHADPAADWPAGILALDAEITLTSKNGERKVKAADFFVGMLATAMVEGEILTAVEAPITTGQKTIYLKLPQSASGFAIVGVALRLLMDSATQCREAFVAITGMAECAYRAKAVEAVLNGKRLDDAVIATAAAVAADGVEPLSDIHASDGYRAHLARVYTQRAITMALKG